MHKNVAFTKGFRAGELVVLSYPEAVKGIKPQ